MLDTDVVDNTEPTVVEGPYPIQAVIQFSAGYKKDGKLCDFITVNANVPEINMELSLIEIYEAALLEARKRAQTNGQGG